jgi:hypothetical protein
MLRVRNICLTTVYQRLLHPDVQDEPIQAVCLCKSRGSLKIRGDDLRSVQKEGVLDSSNRTSSLIRL